MMKASRELLPENFSTGMEGPDGAARNRHSVRRKLGPPISQGFQYFNSESHAICLQLILSYPYKLQQASVLLV